jgi:Tol biopolymer transport system component
LTNDSNASERGGSWSPDGKTVTYLLGLTSDLRARAKIILH